MIKCKRKTKLVKDVITDNKLSMSFFLMNSMGVETAGVIDAYNHCIRNYQSNEFEALLCRADISGLETNILEFPRKNNTENILNF